MAGAAPVHGNEGQFDPLPVTIQIRPIRSGSRLSLLVIFSIDTLPFPPGDLCNQRLSRGRSKLITIQGVHQPSPCTMGGGVYCPGPYTNGSHHMCTTVNVWR